MPPNVYCLLFAVYKNNNQSSDQHIFSVILKLEESPAVIVVERKMKISLAIFIIRTFFLVCWFLHLVVCVCVDMVAVIRRAREFF